MTPSKPATGFGSTPFVGSAGAADKFLSFIADELLPTIDRNYRTRPYRVLIGHSLGGLFAVYALMNCPEVFKGYLISSPSLWWDDQALVKAAQPFFAAHKDLRADLYMTMANEGDTMLGGAWKLYAVLEESKLKLADVRWQFKRSPEEEHGTIPYISTYERLQAIFAGYRQYKVDVGKIVPSPELSPKAVAPYLGEYRLKDELTKVAYEKGKLIATSSACKCELRALTQTKFYCIDIEVAQAGAAACP
jgi:pimeloyl-ACP methyl ester carboxylesterase